MSKMRRMAFEAFKGKSWNEIPGLEGSILMPEDVPDQVIRAIKENRLLVVTHSDTLEIIQVRAQDVEGMIERRALERAERKRSYKEILNKALDAK